MNEFIQLYVLGPECPNGVCIGPLIDYFYDTYDGMLTIQTPRSFFSELKASEKNTLCIINNETNIMHIFNDYMLYGKKGGPHYDEYRITFQSYGEEKV